MECVRHLLCCSGILEHAKRKNTQIFRVFGVAKPLLMEFGVAVRDISL